MDDILRTRIAAAWISMKGELESKDKGLAALVVKPDQKFNFETQLNMQICHLLAPKLNWEAKSGKVNFTDVVISTFDGIQVVNAEFGQAVNDNSLQLPVKFTKLELAGKVALEQTCTEIGPFGEKWDDHVLRQPGTFTSKYDNGKLSFVGDATAAGMVLKTATLSGSHSFNISVGGGLANLLAGYIAPTMERSLKDVFAGPGFQSVVGLLNKQFAGGG